MSNASLRDAEILFLKRADSVENVHAAKKMYANIITGHHSTEERLIAMEMYGRLAVYEGEIAREVLDTSSKKVVQIFDECVDMTDHISPEKIGKDSAEYTYWRAACIGLWAASVGKLKLLSKTGRSRMSDLQPLIRLGQTKFKAYDGYGFNRIEAGMHIRSKFLVICNLYDPKLSLQLVEEALAVGNDNYMTYILKAETLIALGHLSESRAVLEEGIASLESRLVDKRNPIPEYLLAENQIFLKRMREQLRKK